MKQLTKLILLVIVLSAIGLLFFYPYKTQLEPIKEGDETIINVPTYHELVKPGTIQSIKSIISSPFDLYHYTVIFEDNTIYEGTTDCLRMSYNLGNKNSTFIELGGKAKNTIFLGKEYPFQITFKIVKCEVKPGSETSFKLDPVVYIRPTWYDVITQIFLFVIGVTGLILLTKEIYKKI